MKSVLACLLVLAVSAKTSETQLSAESILVEAHRLGNASGIDGFFDQLYLDLQAEQHAEEAAYTTFLESNCLFAVLDDEIEALTTSINNDNAEVEAKTVEMAETSTSVDPLRAEVEAFHPLINSKEQQLAELKETRAADNKVYTERKAETLQALTVIEEIRVFLVNASIGTASELSGDYIGHVTTLLQTEATRHQGMKGQLMRTAASALASGAVDSVYEIMYKMRNEFKEQLDALADLEDEQYASFKEERQMLRDQIGVHLIDMERKKQQISAKHTHMTQLEANIASLNVRMAETRFDLNSKQINLENEHRLCDETHRRHEAGQQRRADALTTLEVVRNTLLPQVQADARFQAANSSLHGDNGGASMFANASATELSVEDWAKSGVGAVEESLKDLREEIPEVMGGVGASWSHGP